MTEKIFIAAFVLCVLFAGIALVTVNLWWLFGAVLCWCVMLLAGCKDG